MKSITKIILFSIIILLLLTNCKEFWHPDGATANVAVTNITNVPTEMFLDTKLILSGTVEPSNASNKNITWSVLNAYDTGAVIRNGNELTVTSLGTNWGWFPIIATIHNGRGSGLDYTQEYGLVINRYNINTGTMYFTAHMSEDEWWTAWMGPNIKVSDFYSNQLKANTDYEITINGNLNTSIKDFWVWMEYNDYEASIDVLLSDQFYMSNIGSGSFNQTFTLRTYNDTNFTRYRNIATLHIRSNETFDKSYYLPNSEQGKIKARINNFGISMVECVTNVTNTLSGTYVGQEQITIVFSRSGYVAYDESGLYESKSYSITGSRINFYPEWNKYFYRSSFNGTLSDSNSTIAIILDGNTWYFWKKDWK